MVTTNREKEAERFEKHSKLERYMLWHGSRYIRTHALWSGAELVQHKFDMICRLSNFMGIISQGLRIAPPEAPVTGYMFGKGGVF